MARRKIKTKEYLYPLGAIVFAFIVAAMAFAVGISPTEVGPIAGLTGLLVGGLIIIILVGIFILFIISCAITYLVAKWMGVKDVTLMKAILASLVGSGIAFVVSLVVGSIPYIGVLAPLIGLVGSIWAIKYFFKIKWMKAFLVWLVSNIISIILTAIVLIIVVVIFIGIAL